MWNEIKNEKELRDFMDMLCYFHDSCIKEISYLSGAYVNEDLSMYPVNEQRLLRMIIQRQFINPSVIEMEFVGLKYLNLYPTDDSYTCEILDATMIFKDNCIYWCDEGNLTEPEIDTYKGTVICASKMRWRPADKFIGKREVYTSS